MKTVIKRVLPIAEAIERLLHPHAEVVVHDISQDKIVAIYHPFSKRRVGDASLLTSEQEGNIANDCIGPYEKINWDGRRLKSVSSVIRDEKKKAVGMLCINLDITMFDKMHQVLNAFMQFEDVSPQSNTLFKDDWQERINVAVHEYLADHHLAMHSLNRSEKKQLVQHLFEGGAFEGKNAASYVANILNISRATVYNYLSSE